MSEPQQQPPRKPYPPAPPETPAVREAIARLLEMEMASCFAAVEPVWIDGRFVGVQAIVGTPIEFADMRYDRGALIQLAVPKSTSEGQP